MPYNCLHFQCSKTIDLLLVKIVLILLAIEIDYLPLDHCDYRLLSTNLYYQSKIIDKYRALSTYRLAFRGSISIDM